MSHHRSLLLDFDLGGVASERPRQGRLDRCQLQLDEQLHWYYWRSHFPLALIYVFAVGQVTPTMLEHLTFGTFIFFGVRLPTQTKMRN